MEREREIFLLSGFGRCGTALFDHPPGFLLEFLDLGHVALVLLAPSESLCELGAGSGNAVFPSLFDVPLVVVGHGSDEVGGRPPLGLHEAQALEVGCGVVRGAEIAAVALVDEQNLVEKVVEGFAGLVEGYRSADVSHVGERAQALDIFQRCAGIQATRRVVPALDGRLDPALADFSTMGRAYSVGLPL